MKKKQQNVKLSNLNPYLEKNLDLHKTKTTNVNILLNRVRLDQKRMLKKNIIFSLTITFFVSLLVMFFII